MCFEVYLVISAGAPRDHHAIFVETAPDLSGNVFQVTGNILNGMTYETKVAKRPEASASFQDKTLLGSVSHANYGRIDIECKKIPSPEKQFDLGKKLYPGVPLRRCQEWTSRAIAELKRQQIIS